MPKGETPREYLRAKRAGTLNGKTYSQFKAGGKGDSGLVKLYHMNISKEAKDKIDTFRNGLNDDNYLFTQYSSYVNPKLYKEDIDMRDRFRKGYEDGLSAATTWNAKTAREMELMHAKMGADALASAPRSRSEGRMRENLSDGAYWVGVSFGNHAGQYAIEDVEKRKKK